MFTTILQKFRLEKAMKLQKFLKDDKILPNCLVCTNAEIGESLKKLLGSETYK